MCIVPWDVINYCDELLAAPEYSPQELLGKYEWERVSFSVCLKKQTRLAKDEVEDLLNGGKITKRIRQELTYRDIEDSAENVWSVLYAAGYLTGNACGSGRCRHILPVDSQWRAP